MDTLSPAVPQTGLFHRVAALRDRWRRRRARTRTEARLRADLEYELQCLDQAGELDGALNHLGLSRAAIPVLLKSYPGSVRRYATMARRVAGATADAGYGLAALSGTRRRCLFCAERRRCERWLESGAREGHAAFCPNADAFERMKRRA